jgi:LmbE family N-acetylglucosaminyl deacetylase
MPDRRKFLKQAGLLALLTPTVLPAADAPTAPSQNNAGLNVVCVGAHPDDPESGCGGVLTLLADTGHHVKIVYLTRGEAGISGKTNDEAAAIRTAEAEAACKLIGAEPIFFGQVDGDTAFHPAAIRKMQQLFKEIDPHIVFAHWPLDSHPDHQVASLLTYQAWIRLKHSFLLYYFEVDAGFQTAQFHPTDYVDITDVADRKKAALFAHTSQKPDSIYDKHHHIMQLFRGREIGVREAEAYVRADGKAANVGRLM